MIYLFVLAALACPQVDIINTTKHPWNSHDQKMLDYSKARCSQLYDDAPCVTFFKKRGEKDYSVLCGEKR